MGTPKIIQIIPVAETSLTQCSVMALDEDGSTYRMCRADDGGPGIHWERIIHNEQERT